MNVRALSAAILCVLAGMASAEDGQKVIGRLGQAVKETTIHATPSSKGRVYSKIPAYQYLVINQTRNQEWYSVILVNGKLGYIKSEVVATLPYDVTVPAKAPTRTSANTSRGGGKPLIDSGNPQVDYALKQSMKYIGTPYVWGGNSLTGGIDCSGFVKEIFEKIDVNLPRTAREQAKHGQPITRLEDLRAGDRLYFWDKKRGYIGHTGIFLGYTQDGGAYFIHSSVNTKGIGTSDLRDSHWRNMLVAARR